MKYAFVKAQLQDYPLSMSCAALGVAVSGYHAWQERPPAPRTLAAIVSGVFSALYVRFHQRWYGYIRKNVWHPGILRATDPRQGVNP